MMLTTEQLGDVIGRDAYGSDGERIGRTDQIFLDDQTGQPEFAALHTGLFGMKTTLVPLAQAVFNGEVLRLPYAKEQVKSAPNVDPDAGHLDQEQERVLYEYYGLPYSEARSDTGLPAEGRSPSAQGTMRRGPQGTDLSGPETDEAMTRSEEQMRVGTTSTERGRARLRKYIVTEQVQQTVPVRRERAVVEREPITGENIDLATSGPELSEEEHEVTLHQETPVVEKRVEPVERVRLSTQTDVSEETVSDEVRKERIETEGDLR
jgi:stress response protein YsnF